MATYYKSRFLTDPVVYVQEQGFWRSHGPGGVKQVKGAIPERLFAGLEQISQDEAERIVRQGPSDRVKNTFVNRRRPTFRAMYAIVGIVVVLAIAAGVGTAFRGPGTAAQNSGNTQSSTSSDASAGEVIATIGTRSVTSGELQARIADFKVQYAGQVPDKVSDPANYRLFQQDVLEYMITYELAAQKAKELNITVTDADVQAEIDSIVTEVFGSDQAKFDDALKQQGITVEQLRSSYKESALLQKVYNEVTKNVATVPASDLSDRQTAAWQAWIAQQKKAAAVTYGAGWQPAATEATAP